MASTPSETADMCGTKWERLWTERRVDALTRTVAAIIDHVASGRAAGARRAAAAGDGDRGDVAETDAARRVLRAGSSATVSQRACRGARRGRPSPTRRPRSTS